MDDITGQNNVNDDIKKSQRLPAEIVDVATRPF